MAYPGSRTFLQALASIGLPIAAVVSFSFFDICHTLAASGTTAPRFDQTFTTDGSVILGPEYEGALLRIIAVGGGGGGSRSASRGYTVRVGAGGGSGAVTYRDIVISGSRQVTWKVGRGGTGGTIPGPGRGDQGGYSKVELSFGPSVAAEGGAGGVFVSSGLTPTKTAVSDWPAPSMGGQGGIPRGVSGEDGQLDFRFTTLGDKPGGAGGKLSVDAGAGGAGGGAAARTFGSGGVVQAEPGSTGSNGQDGLVILQVGISLPAILSDVGEPSPPAAISALEALIADIATECARLQNKCSAEFAAMIKTASSQTLSFQQKAVLLFSHGSLLPDFLKEAVSQIPLTRGAILFQVLAPTVIDEPRVEPPALPLNSRFQELTGQQLDEAAAAYDAAAVAMQASMPNSPERDTVVANLRAHAASMRKELTARGQRGVSYKEAPVDHYGGNIRTINSAPNGTAAPGAGSGRAGTGGGGEGRNDRFGTGRTNSDNAGRIRELRDRAGQNHGSPGQSIKDPTNYSTPNSIPLNSSPPSSGGGGKKIDCPRCVIKRSELSFRHAV